MPSGVIRALGVILLIVTVGAVSCQALLSDGTDDRPTLPPASQSR
jgi:hypothetical protein